MEKQYEIIHYMENGHDVFEEWLKSLKDKLAAVIIARRVKRLEAGHFGEHKPCRSGVWELVIDYGAGYRVYYSITGRTVILFLCAGDKNSQRKDIDRAVEFLRRYKEACE